MTAGDSTLTHSRRCGALRRGAAWLGHAPALWLCYREPLPASLRVPNAIAVTATVIAVALAAITAGAIGVVVAAIAGHVAWGSYLAWSLAPWSRDAPHRSRLGSLAGCAACARRERLKDLARK